jgi:hypothetical protein
MLVTEHLLRIPRASTAGGRTGFALETLDARELPEAASERPGRMQRIEPGILSLLHGPPRASERISRLLVETRAE